MFNSLSNYDELYMLKKIIIYSELGVALYVYYLVYKIKEKTSVIFITLLTYSTPKSTKNCCNN